MFFEYYFPFFVSFLLLTILIYHKQIASSTGLIDYPNERKKHIKPIPKIGGIYIIICTILTCLLLKDNFIERFLISYLVLILGLFLIGFIDDKIEVKASNRLIMQFVVIAFALSINDNLNINVLKIGLISKQIELVNFSNLFTIFCIITLVNATNLVDGKDGLCISIFMYFLIIFIYFFKSHFNLLLINLLICSILFLLFNIRGKIFLGNSGSYLLGGIMSFTTIESYNFEKFEIEIIFLIFFLFGIYMLRVYFERLYRGLNPFTAENNHLHHYIFSYFRNKNLSILVYLSLLIIPFIYQVYFKNYIILILLCLFVYLSSFLFFKYSSNLSE